MKPTHVRLLVDEFSSSFRFYRDVLGLEVTCGAHLRDPTGALIEIDEPIPMDEV